jgi:enterochelin esterase-like enzyme
MHRPAFVLAVAVFAFACGGSEKPAGDASTPVDGGMADDGGASTVDGGVTLRHYTYRAISGISMGAMAASYIGSRHPERFDIIGALGGYMSNVYLMHLVNDRKMKGFCPMQAILDNIADANDPKKNPKIWCGPIKGDVAYKGRWYEHTEDFNNWFFSDSGGAFDRDEGLNIFQDLSMGFGNPSSYNPESPYLPAGVKLADYQAWYKNSNRCKPGHAIVVDTPPFNCNREYNPECKYPLIMFCDGEEPVGCWNGDQTKCGKDNPDYYTLNGAYDPYYPNHNKPLIVYLAADYNGNGMRDYSEPLIINSFERYGDVGTDGCADAIEDGKGGCCKDADLAAGKCTRPYDAGTNPDPNKDNYSWDLNPAGTERNWLYDQGEPFDDYGLDGVKADAARGIPPDYGEGNGKFDYSPGMLGFHAYDMGLNFKTLTAREPDALKRLDIYIDGGIRDIFNSAVNALSVVGALNALGADFRLYDNFFGGPTSLLPSIESDEDFFNYVVDQDLSARAVGKNLMVLYGKPDATEEEIEDGDGAHVGTTQQAVERFLTYFAFVSQRWPGLNSKRYAGDAGAIQHKWFYSNGLGGYRRYSIALPPGYSDPDYSKVKYPVIYFMHGYGMDAMGMAATALIFQGYMLEGLMAKFIMVFPDGRGCYINRTTGARECACADDGTGNGYLCVDKDGVERNLKNSQLPERECNGGTFYVDMVTDKYGDPKSGDLMKYETSVLELDDYITANYRVLPPADMPDKVSR